MVGSEVGCAVGGAVGCAVGCAVGTHVGAGEAVGAVVGASKTRVKFLTKTSRLTIRWPKLHKLIEGCVVLVWVWTWVWYGCPPTAATGAWFERHVGCMLVSLAPWHPCY